MRPVLNITAPAGELTCGLTVREVAQRYGVGLDMVRSWIEDGVVRAVNTSDSEKPRYVITPEALEQFEASRPLEKPVQKKEPKRTLPPGWVDYLPD
jgi:excisionase family DNA binding protein